MMEKAEARLEQLNAEVKRLRAKADEANADVKLEVQRELTDLDEQRSLFEKRVDELRDASEEALVDLSDGFERAWSTLSNSLERAAARFK
jgi:chromosome segregation ATPase